MKRPGVIVLIILFLIVRGAGVFGENPPDIRFERLTTAEGLSSSSVSGISQDSRGFLWFATQAGLDQYDGKKVQVFENEPFNTNSLAHNQIQTLYTDTDGSLWIGTYGGLSRFDPTTGTFTNYAHEPENPQSLINNIVTAICRDREGTLWVGTLGGLNRLDESSNTFAAYLNDPADPSSLPNNVVRDLHTDSLGRLWIGTYGGLSLYDEKSDTFETYTGNGDVKLGSPLVMTIAENPAEPGILYIGTWDGGLCRFDTGTGTSEFHGLPDSRVYTSLFDSSGKLWIGTWGGGLILFVPEDGSISNYRAGAPDEIPHDIVYSFFEDSSGILWIGTNGGGVAKLVNWHNRYLHYRHEEGNPASLPPGKVTAMLQDSSDRLWYGVYNQGLHRLDPDTGEFIHYTAKNEDPWSIRNNIINRIYEDPVGRLWVCSNGGLDLYDQSSDSFTHFSLNYGSYDIGGAVLYEYYEDSRGRIWVGTYTDGLFLFESGTGAITRFAPDEPESRKLTDNLVRVVHEDASGRIWIGTNNGLNRYDPASKTMERFFPGKQAGESISHGNIRDIAETDDGLLLIATMGGGVTIYDSPDDSFWYLTTAEGLASNMVRGTLIRDGRWYFATQIAVSVFDPLSRSFSVINQNSGLLSNELSDGLMKDNQKALHFGSVAGVTVISDLTQVPEGPSPPVVITGITLLGKELNSGTEYTVENPEVELPFRYNSISVEFAVLDYADPVNNSYQVMLEGIDQDWQPTSGRNYISYSALPSGTYTLQVRGAGSRGNWNMDGSILRISVAYPWWKTRNAYVSYAALFITVIVAVSLFLMKREKNAARTLALQQAHARKLEEKVRERTSEIEEARRQAEEMTRTKSIFLANMSHEIRTPLNGIHGMLTLLGRTTLDKEQKRYIQHTQTAAESLFTLVNDALDLERIMAGHLVIEKTPFSIRDVADFITSMYGPQAADRGLSLLVALSPDLPSRLLGDRARVIQILTNLVSNAIKYSDEGTVELHIEPAGETGDKELTLRMRVRDSGPGIPPDKQDAIFEQFTQLDTGHTKKGKGVGLGLSIVKQLCGLMDGAISVESSPGKGSVFSVLLPFGRVDENEGLSDAGIPPITQNKGAGKYILVAEDEAINRLFLQRILESRGYRVKAVSNGRKAVEALEKETFSLVLMDLGMPILGGLDATVEIRRREKQSGSGHIPIVALTAYAYQADVDSCLAAGMDGFISKPLSEGVLFKKIEELTGKD